MMGKYDRQLPWAVFPGIHCRPCGVTSTWSHEASITSSPSHAFSTPSTGLPCSGPILSCIPMAGGSQASLTNFVPKYSLAGLTPLSQCGPHPSFSGEDPPSAAHVSQLRYRACRWRDRSRSTHGLWRVTAGRVHGPCLKPPRSAPFPSLPPACFTKRARETCHW